MMVVPPSPLLSSVSVSSGPLQPFDDPTIRKSQAFPTTSFVESRLDHHSLDSWLHLHPPTPVPNAFVPITTYSDAVSYFGVPSNNFQATQLQPLWCNSVSSRQSWPLSPQTSAGEIQEADPHFLPHVWSDVRGSSASRDCCFSALNSGFPDARLGVCYHTDDAQECSMYSAERVLDCQIGASGGEHALNQVYNSGFWPEGVVSMNSGSASRHGIPGTEGFVACEKTSVDPSHLEDAESSTEVHIEPKASVSGRENASNPLLHEGKLSVPENIYLGAAWESLNQNAPFGTFPAISVVIPPPIGTSGVQLGDACNNATVSDDGNESRFPLHVGCKDGYAASGVLDDDLRSNENLSVSFSQMKHDILLNHGPITSWEPDSQRPKMDQLQWKVQKQSNSTPGSAGQCNLAEGSSKILEQKSPVLDSPCWKGAPAYECSPFRGLQLDECGGLNQQNQIPVNLDLVEVASSPRSSFYPEAGSVRDALTCLLGQRPSSTEAYITGSDCSEVRKVSSMHCSHGMQESGNNHALISYPDVKVDWLSFGHDEGIQTSDAVSLEPFIAGLRKDFDAPAHGSSSDLLSHLSVSTEIPEVIGGSKSSKHFLPRFDAEVLVKTIHNLSQLLLSNYCYDKNALMEQDYEVLQLAIQNLDACLLKKVGVRLMHDSNLELDGSYHHNRKFAEAHKSIPQGGYPNTGMDADDIPISCTREREEKINFSRPIDEITALHADSVSRGLEKDGAIIQTFKKRLKESTCQEGEKNHEILLFKDLWIEAEAALCSMKCELRHANIEMEKYKQRLVKDRDSHPASDTTANYIDLVKSLSSNAISDGNGNGKSLPKIRSLATNISTTSGDIRVDCCEKCNMVNPQGVAGEPVDMEKPPIANPISDCCCDDASLYKLTQSLTLNMGTVADDVGQGNCGKTGQQNLSDVDGMTIDCHDRPDVASESINLEKSSYTNATGSSSLDDAPSPNPTQNMSQNNVVTNVGQGSCEKPREIDLSDDIVVNMGAHDLDMEGNIREEDCSTEIVSLGPAVRNDPSVFIKDSEEQENGVQFAEVISLSSDASEQLERNREYHVHTKNRILDEYGAPSWLAWFRNQFSHRHASLLPDDKPNNLSSDWEHVLKEEIPQ